MIPPKNCAGIPCLPSGHLPKSCLNYLKGPITRLRNASIAVALVPPNKNLVLFRMVFFYKKNPKRNVQEMGH